MQFRLSVTSAYRVSLVVSLLDKNKAHINIRMDAYFDRQVVTYLPKFGM